MSSAHRRGLGRGLEVLVGGLDPAAPELVELPVDAIHANPRQPRKRFDGEAGSGLAESIRSQGVIQPLLVRPRAAGGYEIVAGERRWRAAREAGRPTVPAVVREADDRDTLLLGLIENVAREQLTPVEEEPQGERRPGQRRQPYRPNPAAERAVRAATQPGPWLPPGFGGWLLGRFLGLALLVVAGWVVYDCGSSDRFQVRSVRIQGNVLLSRAEVESVAAVTGANVFWVDRSQVAERVMSAMQAPFELVLEVHESQARQLCEVAREVMEKAPLPAIELRVPLVVEARAGKNWDEAH